MRNCHQNGSQFDQNVNNVCQTTRQTSDLQISSANFDKKSFNLLPRAIYLPYWSETWI